MKRLSTNQKFNAIQDYVLNAIEDVDNLTPLETPKDKVTFVYAQFLLEKWKFPEDRAYYKNNEREAFKDWLQGLPSSIHIAYANYKIVELGKEFGLLRKNASEVNEDLFLDRWFGLMTGQFYILKARF